MTDADFQSIKNYFEQAVIVNTLNDAVTLSGRVPHLTQYALDQYKMVMDTYKLAKIATEQTYSIIFIEFMRDSNKEYRKDEIATFINSDKRYMNVKFEMERLYNICIFLERTIDSMKQVSYNIKNVIDITKYLSGN